MVPKWKIFDDFLRPVFAASRVQHISVLHLKFALRPHHVCKYGRHPICDGADQARKKRNKERKKERKKERRNHRMEIQWSALFHRATIKNSSSFHTYIHIYLSQTHWSIATYRNIQKTEQYRHKEKSKTTSKNSKSD